MFLLFILVWGLCAGWVANLILGGSTRPADWTPLLVAGLLGSFVGGAVLSLVFEGDLDVHPTGFVGSILGALILLAGYRWYQGRSA
ncbi:MAG: GlsB/YeaQ/YmgE family stress response membrane protein [Acidimicrobiales bacterium]|nr:GlsB/YeaQ/YmgE family stress response membrane protein [Acidimicrobiales bacterium]